MQVQVQVQVQVEEQESVYESLLLSAPRAGVRSPYDRQAQDIVALMVENILNVPDNISAAVLDRYSVSSLSPSLLPNWYPTMRVWTYNTSAETRYRAQDYDSNNEDHDHEHEDHRNDNDNAASGPALASATVPVRPVMGGAWRAVRQVVFGVVGGVGAGERQRPGRSRKAKQQHHAGSASASPARQNRFLTPLGYSEWHLDLDEANEAHVARPVDPPLPVFQLEYATYPTAELWQEYLSCSAPTQEQAQPPVPRALLDAELARHHASPGNGSCGGFELPAALRSKTDWEYPALTVGAYLDLALRLRTSRKHYIRGGDTAAPAPTADAAAGALERTMWGRFVSRLYADSGVTVEVADA